MLVYKHKNTRSLSVSITWIDELNELADAADVLLELVGEGGEWRGDQLAQVGDHRQRQRNSHQGEANAEGASPERDGRHVPVTCQFFRTL